MGKVDALLKPRLDYRKARLTLSPMLVALKMTSVEMSESKPRFSVGKGESNDLIVRGPMVSRNHLMIEFIPSKGAVYVADLSTNGTFVNGRKLTDKGSAKVVLWHGDELLLQNDGEFGYVVNLDFF